MVVAVRRVSASAWPLRSLLPVSVTLSRAVSIAATRVTRPVPIARVVAVARSVVIAGRATRVAWVIPAVGPVAWAVTVAVASTVRSTPRTRTARCITSPVAVATAVRSEAFARSVRGARTIVISRPVPITRTVVIRAGPAAIAPVSAGRPISAGGVKSSIGPVPSLLAITRTGAIAGAGAGAGCRTVALTMAVARSVSRPISGLGSITRRAVTATGRVAVTPWPVILPRPVLLPRSVPVPGAMTRLRRRTVPRGLSVAAGLPGHRVSRRLTAAPASVLAARGRDRPADEGIGGTTREAAFHRVLPGQPAAIIGSDLRVPAWAVGPVLGQRLWTGPDPVNLGFRFRFRPLVLLVRGPLLWSWKYPLGLRFLPGGSGLAVLLSLRL